MSRINKWEHVHGSWIELEDHTRDLLDLIQNLPGMNRVVGLADCHMGRQETPTSVVTQNDSYVIPAMGSNVINCGIGLIRMGVKESALSHSELNELWTRFVVHSNSDDGIWSDDTVQLAIAGGAAAIANANILPSEIADGFENRGVAPVNAVMNSNPSDWSLNEILPWNLRLLSVSRYPRKAVFLGNHFLELQRIERDVTLINGSGRQVVLSKGELVLMVHLDHRFTGAWNYHYVYRRLWGKKPFWYKAVFRASKLSFHKALPVYRSGRRKWSYFMQDMEYIALPLDMPEAARYLAAYAAARNYGYAARGEVYAAILKAIGDVWSGVHSEVVWDSAHESIESTSEGVVSRKGAAAAVPGQPALLAGSYDYPSFIGVVGREGSHFMGYDHGSSYLAKLTDADAPAVEGEYVSRWLINGSNSVKQTESVPLRAAQGIRRQVETLKEAGIIGDGTWATPISSLKGRL